MKHAHHLTLQQTLSFVALGPLMVAVLVALLGFTNVATRAKAGNGEPEPAAA